MAQTKVMTRVKADSRKVAPRPPRWRSRRMLAGATIVAVALGGGVVWQTTHGGRGRAHGAAAQSSSPAAGASNQVPESAFAKQPPFTGPAVTKYGQPALQMAYRQLVNFAFNIGWDTSLMAKNKTALKPLDFAPALAFITPSCAKAYAAMVTKVLANDKTAIRDLEGTMFFAVGGVGGTQPLPGPLAVTNRAFTRAKIAIDKSHGVERLSLSFTAKAVVHLQDASGKQYAVRTGRAVRYLLVPNSGADASTKPFLIDAWGSHMQTKAVQTG